MSDAILLDRYDAARVLALSTRHLNALVRCGEIPHIVLPGGDVRFLRDDLETWALSHRLPVQEARDA